MREWKKMKVFEMADELVISTYNASVHWPKEHRYGLVQQLTRAVVSVASNIVEGCSRDSQREFYRFIEVAYGSACEAQYQLSIARRLQFSGNIEELETGMIILSKSLNSLMRTISQEQKAKS